MSEYERCDEMSEAELLDTIRQNPLFKLFPAVQVYVKRNTVKPEIKPEPEPEPTTKRCNYCMGSGIIALTRMKCANCTDGRVAVGIRKD